MNIQLTFPEEEYRIIKNFANAVKEYEEYKKYLQMTCTSIDEYEKKLELKTKELGLCK